MSDDEMSELEGLALDFRHQQAIAVLPGLERHERPAALLSVVAPSEEFRLRSLEAVRDIAAGKVFRRPCLRCRRAFEATTTRQRYCGSSCRKRASEERRAA